MIVEAAWKEWPRALPQHGPGRKHNRPIILAPWQREIVDAHPRPFLRGLIHSDGCRTVNRFKTKLPSGRVAEYAYPRWFFSNRSADIRGLFCEYCERLGIRTTQSNPRNISVAHRDSVAALDAFPEEFLRGLIHSDGCRTVNRFKTKLPSGRVAEYAYPRYFFSNLSADIRGLFCEYCNKLGVRWTQSNHRNISVSHRRSVAALDEFIGPKR